jgi:hypothetical protein
MGISCLVEGGKMEVRKVQVMLVELQEVEMTLEMMELLDQQEVVKE